MELATFLKDAAKDRGISQYQLAEKLNISPSALSRKLNGKRTIYIDEFYGICVLLRLKAQEVLDKTYA